ncbi:hypothetical protein HXX76_012755 [Chlamydomonas incerta]|uniref:ABC1 atypical kinase-like domain-containing protein n=1 Tax=Chlamydomonas incerta TaxID=51695 RepID=A0A835VT84_CHLIN|nr:hypothetical protein HXX76_012755 [Chlamydomonas incerta]|eukprot:KAG2426970.1 hypothetical protein HXX76_012755 [Chlamydomonas incerta]
MQQESLAVKASRNWKPVVTPAAKRSAPVLADGEQDVAAPAKMPRVVPGVVLPLPIAGGLAAAGAAQALAGCKKSRVAQQEPRLQDQVAAPCKVTILRVDKHLDLVADARPMVWQANSVSTTSAVKELQPNDGVILAVSTTEGHTAHIAAKLPPPAVDTQALPSKYVCFAVAAVKEVHRPAGGAAADTGTWVELEPASLVWTNTPWQQMIDDMGVPDKAPTTSRTTEKQANIAVEVRHYAQQVGALLSRAAAAHAGAAASGRRLVGRLAPCPTGRFLRNRKAGVQPAAAAAAGSAAGGKQGHDSSSGYDDSSSGYEDSSSGYEGSDDDVGVEAEDGIAQQKQERAPDISPRFILGVTFSAVRVSFMEWLDDCASVYQLCKSGSPLLNDGLYQRARSAVRRMWLDAGVLHCDLHLDNVLVARADGRIFIIDYGMAVRMPPPVHSQLSRYLGEKRLSPMRAYNRACKDLAHEVLVHRGYDVEDGNWHDDGSFLAIMKSYCCKQA